MFGIAKEGKMGHRILRLLCAGLASLAAVRTSPGQASEEPPQVIQISGAANADGAQSAAGVSPNVSWYRCANGNASSTWELRANALFLHRSSPGSQPLVTTPAVAGGLFVPGATTLIDANQFGFGYRTGFEVDLVGDNLRGSGWGIEARYFRVANWSANVDAGLSPVGSIVLYAQPIGNQLPTRVSSSYTSQLDSFELDLRRTVTDNITFLAGYRHLNLNDGGGVTINQDVGPGINLGTSTIRAINHLDGFQVGADAVLWRGRRFDIEGVGRAGIYGNRIHNDARTVQLPLPPFSSSADDTSTAFVGELGLTGVLQLTPRISLRAGYSVMWLTGVGTASRQVPVSNPFANFPAGGVGTAVVDSSGSVFYHGATVGLAFRY